MSNSDRNLRLKQQLAMAENSSVKTLTKLSKHRELSIRQAVASNPNTPIEILEKLSLEFPEIVTANPVFDLLLLENPDSEFIKLALARSSTTSAKTLLKLVKDDDIDIDIDLAIEIAKNNNATLEVLEALFDSMGSKGDNYYSQEVINEICKVICSHPNASAEMLDTILEGSGNSHYGYDGDEEELTEIYLRIARHPHTSAVTLKKLPLHSRKENSSSRLTKS